MTQTLKEHIQSNLYLTDCMTRRSKRICWETASDASELADTSTDAVHVKAVAAGP
jgi:hypothetical protein